MEALYTGRETWMVCNVPNQGTVPYLPQDAVIETACVVNATGAIPLPQLPKAVWAW